jgi:ABC-2 type transport system permease protein
MSEKIGVDWRGLVDYRKIMSTTSPRIPTHHYRAQAWRSFWVATWLGWQIESNWTDPFLFAIYSIVKPLAGAAILVVMYSVITNGNFSNPMFSYIYLGNAFYIYVGAVMTGVSWAVVDDREHYRTLKYMYIAPIRIPMYLLGRGVGRFISASIAVLVTVMAGALFLHVPLDVGHVDWPLFFLTLFLGVVMLAMMGLLLAGITLLIARHEGVLGEATAAGLYIFSGAIFPLEVLPAWIRPVFGVAAFFVFRYCDHLARERGLIDQTTNY